MVDWAREYADLFDTMQRSFADDVRGLRKRLADVLEQHADADANNFHAGTAYRHAAQLVQGVLCDCPGVFHPVEHGA